MVVKKDTPMNIASFRAESLYRRFNKIFTPDLLEEAGVSSAVLTDPDTEVVLEDHCRLMELAAKKTEDDAIGLKIGSSAEAGNIGPLGYVIFNSPTIRSALVRIDHGRSIYSKTTSQIRAHPSEYGCGIGSFGYLAFSWPD